MKYSRMARSWIMSAKKRWTPIPYQRIGVLLREWSTAEIGNLNMLYFDLNGVMNNG